MNRPADPTLVVLLVATAVLMVVVAVKDSAMLGMAVQKSGRLFGGIWAELLLGFVLAGVMRLLCWDGP